MSMIAPSPDIKHIHSDDDICHLVCDCQMEAAPRIAMCGWDCTEMPAGEPRFPCVICRDLYRGPCPVCGESL
jgi:hypothetical protein